MISVLIVIKPAKSASTFGHSRKRTCSKINNNNYTVEHRLTYVVSYAGWVGVFHNFMLKSSWYDICYLMHGVRVYPIFCSWNIYIFQRSLRLIPGVNRCCH